MRHELIEVMQDQVRSIYRAVTGNEIPAPPEGADVEQQAAAQEEITLRFAALEALARGEPGIAARVPPFSFTPALDVIESGGEVVVELALPGVDRDAITVDVSDGRLVVTGVRPGHLGSEGGTFTHAEIPRGPFFRDLRVPFAIREAPVVELDRGLLRIRLRPATERTQAS